MYLWGFSNCVVVAKIFALKDQFLACLHLLKSRVRWLGFLFCSRFANLIGEFKFPLMLNILNWVFKSSCQYVTLWLRAPSGFYRVRYNLINPWKYNHLFNRYACHGLLSLDHLGLSLNLCKLASLWSLSLLLTRLKCLLRLVAFSRLIDIIYSPGCLQHI
jgi:hypothetical protein